METTVMRKTREREEECRRSGQPVYASETGLRVHLSWARQGPPPLLLGFLKKLKLRKKDIYQTLTLKI
jgi:hypothetical protein